MAKATLRARGLARRTAAPSAAGPTAKWVGRCGECQAWGTVEEAGAPRRPRDRAGAGHRARPADRRGRRPSGARARADRRGRARPGARRRAGARGRRAAGRRARRRQVDPAARGRGAAAPAPGSARSTSPARSPPPRSGCAPTGSGRCTTSSTSPPRPTCRPCSATSRRSQPDAAGGRLGADHRHRRGRGRGRRRDPGPRGRRRADPGRQGPRHRHRPGRPRHQGRLDRRAPAARAPRRRRAALRGRPPLTGCAWSAPSRTASARPTRSAASTWTRTGITGLRRPQRAVPLPAHRAGRPAPASRSPWRGAGRWWPRCRPWSRRPRCHRRGARPPGSTPPGSPWCSPCSSAAAGSAWASATSTPPPSAGSGSASRPPTSRWRWRSAGATGDLALPQDVVAIGEVGLAGEVRPVPGVAAPARRGRPARLHPRDGAARTGPGAPGLRLVAPARRRHRGGPAPRSGRRRATGWSRRR